MTHIKCNFCGSVAGEQCAPDCLERQRYAGEAEADTAVLLERPQLYAHAVATELFKAGPLGEVLVRVREDGGDRDYRVTAVSRWFQPGRGWLTVLSVAPADPFADVVPLTLAEESAR